MTTRPHLGRLLLLCGSLLVVAPIGSPARATNNGAPDPDILIDAVPTHDTEIAARAACAKDAVVWADRHTGTYYSRSEPQYANTQAGAFACRRDALKARYWDTDPHSHMEGRPGRIFPYQPLYPGS